MLAGVSLLAAPVAAACDSGPTYEDWAATDGAAGRINLDEVQQAFKDSNSATEFEKRVNEIYEGDGIVLIRVEQDGNRTNLEGWEDLNKSKEIEDRNRRSPVFNSQARRSARDARVRRQQLLPSWLRSRGLPVYVLDTEQLCTQVRLLHTHFALRHDQQGPVELQELQQLPQPGLQEHKLFQQAEDLRGFELRSGVEERQLVKTVLSQLSAQHWQLQVQLDRCALQLGQQQSELFWAVQHRIHRRRWVPQTCQAKLDREEQDQAHANQRRALDEGSASIPVYCKFVRQVGRLGTAPCPRQTSRRRAVRTRRRRT